MTQQQQQQQQSQSPSHVRRQALREADQSNTIQILSSYPLEQYYALADRLLDLFHQALFTTSSPSSPETDHKRLDDAYVYGLRFATLSLETIPKHPMYKKQHQDQQTKKLVLKNSRQVQQVLTQLEHVTQRMDAQEKVKQQQKQKEEEEEEKKKQQELAAATAAQKGKEEEEKRQEERKRQLSKASVQSSARSKLAALQSQTTASSRQVSTRSATATAATPPPTTTTNSTKSIPQQQHHDKPSSSRSVLANETSSSSIPSVQSTESKQKDRKKKKKKKSSKKEKREESSFSVATTTKSRREIQQEQEWETMKMLCREAQEEEEREAQAAIAAVTAKIQKEEQEGAGGGMVEQSPKPKRKMIGRDEQRTIQLLRSTIQQHEDRLAQIEHVQIPYLIEQAKALLKKKNHRKEALGCIARKRRLEQSMDVSKSAIFQMETQLLLLESAMEDREVACALQAASDTMEALQNECGVLTEEEDDVTRVLQDVSDRVSEDLLLDEDELLQELGESTHEQDLLPDGNESILSLPSVTSMDLPMPATDIQQIAKQKKKNQTRKPALAASWA